MRIFTTIIRKVGHSAVVISGIFLIGMMLLTVSNILFRGFGGVIAGTYELIEALIIVVVAGALGYTELENSHVSVRIVVSRLSQRAQGIFGSFIYLIGTGLWVIIIWAGIEILSKRWLAEETELLSVPILPLRFVWILGLIFLCLVLLINLSKALIQAVKK